ncbi:MAG: homoserine dehydrogenase [Luteibaculaceae bacterium]
MQKELNIGLFGFGCVGEGLYKVLHNSGLLKANIKTIVVKNRDKKRSLPAETFQYDANHILNDAEINTVVELIDNSAEAYEIVKQALISGKNVVTANKKMLAEHLSELLALAKEHKVSLLYEGAVAGSIPIIRNLEEYYNNDSLSKIEGIVNGTTNYILTQTNLGKTYQEALKEAQVLGFAESDPTLDVQGFDAKYKLAILMKHAFGVAVEEKELLNVGINNLKPQDVTYALEKGYRIKLIAKAQKFADSIVGFVLPQFVTANHAVFNVNNEFNAVAVEAAFSDKQLFTGKGAGSFPTASAVLSDVSALQYQYKYEFRKSYTNRAVFTNNFSLLVFIGSNDLDLLERLPWESIQEKLVNPSYSYVIGRINVSDLKALNLNSNPNLSVIALPDALEEESLVRANAEQESISAAF